MGSAMSSPLPAITVVIPTYQRGAALLQTLRHLEAVQPPPAEILVVDQTKAHPADVAAELLRLEAAGRIRRLRFAPPSIPRAMNIGLREAISPVVLFLDDDVVPDPGLIAAHAARHGRGPIAVCGQVLQPGEVPDPEANRVRKTRGLRADLDFRFCGTESAELRNAMAGNLSVVRAAALALGGFDEQFIGSAYRFETDFARRWMAAGGRIVFAPEASVRHLRLPTGGTRSQGDHLERPSPLHACGDYYFALRHARGVERWAYCVRRLIRETCNRHHARHPGRIPLRIVSELRALGMAIHRHREGPRGGGSP